MLLKSSGWLMLAGVVAFSGSLYLLSLTGQRWLGAVTPLGGACVDRGMVVTGHRRAACRLILGRSWHDRVDGARLIRVMEPLRVLR